MRFWEGIIIMCFIAGALDAQSPVIDSLTVAFETLEQEPLARDYNSRKAQLSLQLGQAYHELGAYQDAQKHLTTAHQLACETGDSVLLAETLDLLAANHLKNGATDSAIFYLNGELQIAYNIQSFEHQKMASAQLYAIHKEKNNHAEALRYLEIYQSASDTLIKGEHLRTVTRLEKDYSTRIEQYEDTTKLQRLQLVTTFALSGFSVAVLVILLLIMYFRMKQAREREMRKIHDQLMVQERMASLGMLTAGIVHEIKNPLNFINNFAGINRRLATEILTTLSHGPTNDNPHHSQGIQSRLLDLEQNSRDIETSGKEINRIVHTMMDHSRGPTSALQMIDLNTLAAENVQLVYQSYRASHPGLQVQIFHHLDPTLPKIEIFPYNIARVVVNILSNAFYALNLKQEGASDFEPCLDVTTRAVEDAVELTIWDNGTGIPQELRQKIFTPFFTTKPIGLGNSGLGLSISYNIVVHEHHGRLEVESEPGAFTQFRMILPLTAQK